MNNISTRDKFPELYNPRPAPVPDSPTPRTKPMRLLNLSLSRSGTMSMREALHTLGIPTYHFVDIMSQPADLHYWNSFMERKYPGISYHTNPTNPDPVPIDAQVPPPSRAEFETILIQYSALSDMPACYLGPELVAAYPEAQVIIIQRPFEKWYRSFRPVIYDNLADWKARIGRYIAPDTLGLMIYNAVCCIRGPWGCRSATPEEFDRLAAQKYQEHYDGVKEFVPKGKLLEYTLGSGWEPLCEFLECEVPDMPFPHVNESEEVMERAQVMMTLLLQRSLIKWATRAIVVVLPIVGAWWAYR